MRKLIGLLQLNFLPASVDLGLLVLRLWFGLSMAILHGWAKFTGFSQMAPQFPDLLKIGSKGSLAMAIFGELVCPILVALGLFTRFGAATAGITMAVAFFIVHKGQLVGQGNGEMAFLYLSGFVVLLITGPGRYSLDAKLGKGSSAKTSRTT